MDTGTEKSKELPSQIDVYTDTRDVLARGAQIAKRDNYDDYFIVDVDAHHTETESWMDILQYIEDPVIREQAITMQKGRGGGATYLGGRLNHQDVGGRIPHQMGRRETVEQGDVHRDVVLTRRAMDSMGINKMIIFPTPMLGLAEHPQVDFQVMLSRAYTRWITENILPHDDDIKILAYLPLNEPKAALQMIKDFGESKGVVGFMVTGSNSKPVYHNDLMPIYHELEERGIPLAFHGGYNWEDGSMAQMNRFIGVHALSFVICNLVHMTNWVVNGLPERFPKLNVTWIESGLAWLPFLMQRLDNEYMMRTSECPLLKRKPSEYITDMYYCCQPMEKTDMQALENTFRMIKAESQLMYASDWPHWDFDMPNVIFDLPFLSDQAKRNILGETAKKIFPRL